MLKHLQMLEDFTLLNRIQTDISQRNSEGTKCSSGGHFTLQERKSSVQSQCGLRAAAASFQLVFFFPLHERNSEVKDSTTDKRRN